MGVAYNSRIVTDGLVLCLDAGNKKSYPDSGDIWTDLSGNGRNGTLNNGVGYNSANGGLLSFDGSNDFIQCSGSLTLTAATFIVWIKRGVSSGNTGRAGFIMSRTPTATGMNMYPSQISGVYPNFLGYHWNDDGGTYNWNSGLIVPLDSWSMCAISVTSSSATAYLYQASGLTTATNTTSHSSTTMLDIEVAQQGGNYYRGSVAQALIYNRALSAAEIQQNYLATKSRYFSNLPVASSSIPGTIVTTGLQLYLDAGVSSSYPGSGSTWTDLSGNGRNGTLNNMDGTNFDSANGGSLVFNGSDEFVQCSGSILAETATFIVWIKRGAATGGSATAGFIMSRTPSATGMNFASSFNLGYHWNDDGGTYGWNSGLIVPLDSWSMCAISVTSSSATAYLYQASGLTTATNSIIHSGSALEDVEIGTNGSKYYLGSIAQASVYNRALSAGEISQNYNALKGRYGLS